jgi:hypothetical protein
MPCRATFIAASPGGMSGADFTETERDGARVVALSGDWTLAQLDDVP